MTWPIVTVNQVNQLLGETTEVERTLLFIGTGTKNVGKTLAVNAQSDFDALLGEGDSPLKSDVLAALANAGQNWWGFVHVLAADSEPGAWVDAVKAAQVSCSVEGVVLSDDVAAKAQINQAATLRSELIAKYGRWVWFILAVQGMQQDEAQADYLVRLSTLQEGIAEKAVQLVPRLWGNEPGVLAGRLCNRAVTIADSPARVKTGALLSTGSDELPKDGAGETLELATLQALEAQRYSVPMWYPDYDGFYWADGRTLDVEGGDYQSIETLRIVDKAAEMGTIKDLMEGARGVGTNYGVGLDEQLAVLGQLNRTLGTEASSAYEGFMTGAMEGAKKLGLSFTDSTGKMLSMPEMLIKLQGKYGKSLEGNLKAQAELDAAFGDSSAVIKHLYGNVALPEHYRLISQPARVMRALSHPPDLTRRILSADSIYTRSNPNLISFKSTARR